VETEINCSRAWLLKGVMMCETADYIQTMFISLQGSEWYGT